MCSEMCKMKLPDGSIVQVGDELRLGRFQADTWILKHGWYSCDGNRSTCGWYLIRTSDHTVKPLLETDLDDCYYVTHA